LRGYDRKRICRRAARAARARRGRAATVSTNAIFYGSGPSGAVRREPDGMRAPEPAAAAYRGVR